MKYTELMPGFQTIIQEISARQKHPFGYENLVLCLSALNPTAEPREIATLFNASPLVEGKTLEGEDVIKFYKKMHISNIPERKKSLEVAVGLYALLVKALDGDLTALQEYRTLCNEQTSKTTKRAVFQLLRHHIADQLTPEAHKAALRLNREFSGECLDEILDVLEEHLNSRSGKAVETDPTVKLQAELDRARAMLRSMQDDFDERLENSKLEEQEMFFSNLNSQHYGYILDLLQSAQNGFKKLREKRIRVPVELHSVQSLIRRMMEFVDDYGVKPMMTVDSILTITVQNISELQYEGSPFASDKEVKRVRVVSPGWKLEEHNIVISYPRVVEIE